MHSQCDIFKCRSSTDVLETWIKYWTMIRVTNDLRSLATLGFRKHFQVIAFSASFNPEIRVSPVVYRRFLPCEWEKGQVNKNFLICWEINMLYLGVSENKGHLFEGKLWGKRIMI